MKNDYWKWDSQNTSFCPYCGAETYEVTSTTIIVCFKCKRIYREQEYLGKI